jgi:flagellar biosynthetic protein FliR
MLTFARCAGFAARAPGLSHPSVPSSARVVSALALTLAVAPGVTHLRGPDGPTLAIAMVGEALLGAAIGAFGSLLYDGAYAGGRIVDDYAGVRAIAPGASMVAPSGFGRIWSLAFTAGFFLLGAYRIVIPAFASSFALVPPGGAVSRDALFAYAIALPETIVLVALAVAGPAIALAFVVQIALAALARTIPRFGTVTLASPFVFAAAILATAIAVPVLESAAAHPFVNPPLLHATAR